MSNSFTETRLRISNKQKGGYTILQVMLSAEGKDAARSPKLIVTLPRYSQVNGVKINNQKHSDVPYQIMGNANLALPHDPPKSDGYVQFDLPNLNREEFIAEISLTPVNDSWEGKASAGAFVFSLSPELHKENNYQVLYLN